MSTEMKMTNASDSELSCFDDSDTYSSDSSCDEPTTKVADQIENQCLVGDKICSKCKQPFHYPLECAIMKKWMYKCEEESSDEEEDSDMKSDEESVEDEDQFTKYYDVYAKHEESIAEEGKVSMEDIYERFKNPKVAAEDKDDDVEMEVDEIAKRPAGFMERLFLKKACKVLRESRYCLMQSCIYAYNITDETQKINFKELTDYLQFSVEKLSEFLENDVHKLSEEKKSREMNGAVDFCENRRKTIIEYIKEN